MAWNPSPQVAAARDFGKKFKKQIVIIYSYDLDAGTIEYASYGETRELCERAKAIAEDLWSVAAYADVSR